MFDDILENTRVQRPMVHAITNYVTANDCANVVLAAGGSPILADDIHEVADITALSQCLAINMGTLNPSRMEAMAVAGSCANNLGRPIVLDPVGAGASPWRSACLKSLLETLHFSVIRGNFSEIKAMYYGYGNPSGVNAHTGDSITEKNLSSAVNFAKNLSKTTGSVMVINGAVDVVAYENTAYIIYNGHPHMARITGSGCMLTVLIGTFCGANPHRILEATVAATVAFGLCGEFAAAKVKRESSGLSSFRTYLIDAVSQLDEQILKEGGKFEIR